MMMSLTAAAAAAAAVVVGVCECKISQGGRERGREKCQAGFPLLPSAPQPPQPNMVPLLHAALASGHLEGEREPVRRLPVW